jgi:hypothetical protein
LRRRAGGKKKARGVNPLALVLRWL